MYDMKFDSNNFDKQRKTKINKNFQQFIVIYNNVFSFCSEMIIVNKKHNIFNIFRVMNEIKHFFEIFFVKKKTSKSFVKYITLIDFKILSNVV